MTRFRLVYAAFPAPADVVGGFTFRFPSGRTSILINTLKSKEDQIRILKHELSHILLGHLDDDRTSGYLSYLHEHTDIEDDANKRADLMTDEELADLMRYQTGETVYCRWEQVGDCL